MKHISRKTWLFLSMLSLLLALFSFSLAAGSNTTLTITPTFTQNGNLNLQIDWNATVGPVYNEDTYIDLSFSGIQTAGLIPRTRCAMEFRSSLARSGSIEIDGRYLCPGTLQISGSINHTNGSVSVEIPSEGMPEAPSLTVDKPDPLLGETFSLLSEFDVSLGNVMDYYMLRTGPDQSVLSRYWKERSETSLRFEETIKSFPDEAEGDEAVYTYQLRVKYGDNQWSAFCDPVAVTIHRLGTLPTPEFDMPESIPAGSPGFDVRIKNAQEGAVYELTCYGNNLVSDQIDETGWHLSPVSTGTAYGSVKASRPGYEEVYADFTVTVSEAGADQPAAPDVILLEEEQDGLTQGFRVMAEGMTEAIYSYYGNQFRIPCQSGDIIPVTFYSYQTYTVSFYAKIGDRWSAEKQITFELKDPFILESPVFTADLSENEEATEKQPLDVHLQHVPGAVRYELTTWTTGYNKSYPYSSYWLDRTVTPVEATGETLLVSLPGNLFQYREETAFDQFTNYYSLMVTAYPEEGSEMKPSSATISFRVIQAPLPDIPAPEVIDLLVVGTEIEGHADENDDEYFEFVPEENGFYILSPKISSVVYAYSGTIYDEEWNKIVVEHDEIFNLNPGSRIWELRLGAFLEKGNRYYFHMRRRLRDNPNARIGNFSVRFEKRSLPELVQDQQTENVSCYAEPAFFSLVPTADGFYTFSAFSMNARDYIEKRIVIYDSRMRVLADSGFPANREALFLHCELEAGKTYYCAFRGRNEKVLAMYRGREDPSVLSAEVRIEGDPVTGTSLTVRGIAKGGVGFGYRYGLAVSVLTEAGTEDLLRSTDYSHSTVENEWTIPLYQNGKYTLTVYTWDMEYNEGSTSEVCNVTGTDLFEERVQLLASQFISENDSEYERALAAHDFLTYRAIYSNITSQQSASDVLMEGIGNGRGFAEAFYRLLKAMNMDVCTVFGSASGSSQHAWNEVKIDGEWYAVDAALDKAGQSTHTYCFLNDALFNETHTKSEGASAPACNSLKNNYYVRSGYAAENWISLFREDLSNQLNAGERIITLSADYSLPTENGAAAKYNQWAIVEYILNQDIWVSGEDSYRLRAVRQDGSLIIQAKQVPDLVHALITFDPEWKGIYAGGDPVIPVYQVELKGVLLAEGVDYEAVYENNVNAGTASVTVKGIEPCVGEKTTTFPIEPCSMDTAEILLTQEIHEYTGAEIRPEMTVTLNGRELAAGTDYQAVYAWNKEVGEALILLNGLGNYTGRAERSFSIVQRELRVIIDPKEKIYGEADPDLTWFAEGLLDGDSLTVPLTREPGESIGEYAIIIGDLAVADYYHLQMEDACFTILPRPVGKASFRLQPNQFIESGIAKEPFVLATDLLEISLPEDGALIPGDQYDVVYSNNLEAGEGEVRITGKNNYTGTLSLPFTIHPAGTSVCRLPAQLETLEAEFLSGTAFLELLLPDRAVTLADSCLLGSNVVQVTIPSAETVIDPEAFSGLDGITLVSPPELRIGSLSVEEFCREKGFWYEKPEVSQP